MLLHISVVNSFLLLSCILFIDIPNFICCFISWWIWPSWMLLWMFVCKSLCGHIFSFLIGNGVQLLGHMINVCLTFQEIARWFLKVAVPFYIPTSNIWVFQFLHILTNVWNFQSFDFSYSTRHIIVFHCFFVCLFLAAPCGMWDLSFLTRDWTHSPWSGSVGS